jgi:hypothetical protein
VAAARLHDAYLLHLADRPGRAAPPAWAGGVPAGARAIR